jgi:hypothetical protein
MAEFAEAYSAELRANLKQALRERDDWKYDCSVRDKQIESLKGKYEMVGVDLCTMMGRAEAAEASLLQAREALQAVLAIPAVRQVIGGKHTKDCDCSCCRANKLLAALSTSAKEGKPADVPQGTFGN